MNASYALSITPGQRRWRWDLNPRRGCPLTRFRGVRPRPLGDSTAAEPTRPARPAGGIVSAVPAVTGVPELPEEAAQQPAALVRQYAADHLDVWSEPAVVQHVPQRARRAGPRVGGSVHQPAKPRGANRSRAHRARLQGDDQRAPGQPPAAQRACRRADRHDLGVRRGITVGLAAVPGAGDDRADWV